MDKTDRLRDYGLAFLLYEHGLGICGYELIRELFIFIKLILNSYLLIYYYKNLFYFVPHRSIVLRYAVTRMGILIIRTYATPSYSQYQHSSAQSSQP